MAAGRHVIGIDSSTQSTKAIAFDARGAVVAEGRASIGLTTPAPGFAEQDCEDWWRTLGHALGEVAAAVGPETIQAVAIANQRETVAFLDANGAAIRPAMLWLDTRAAGTLDAYAERMGRERMHRITGKPVDTVPVVFRLDWLRRMEPETLDRSAAVLDVHAYLAGRLTGRRATPWSSADPFGTFDIAALDWSNPILESVGLTRRQLPELVKPGSLVGRITPAAAVATGLTPGTPVFAGGGDGQCSGLGANAMAAGAIYLNLGTATILGVGSRTPVLSRHWRTMTGPTGEGYFLESVQKAGAYFVNWVVDTFAGGRADPTVFATLEAEAARLRLGSEGLTMTPYIIGAMNPHWDPKARAAIVGLSADHTRAHVYRAALEALTAEIGRGVTAMAGEGLAMERIRAIGGGAQSALWLQMISDATGLEVDRSLTVEATALGAGIIAAVGAGWFASFDEAAEAMTAVGGTVRPDTAQREAWAALSARQAGIYGDTRAYRGSGG